jgi:hypothetical protein
MPFQLFLLGRLPSIYLNLNCLFWSGMNLSLCILIYFLDECTNCKHSIFEKMLNPKVYINPVMKQQNNFHLFNFTLHI